MGANTLYTEGDFSYRWMMLDGYNSGLIDNEKKERPGVVEGQQLTITASNMDLYFFELVVWLLQSNFSG
jgi:hypothetical protein